ncbi:DUF3017 domain-containing protein [Rudaeicoccus suwonensis]|uniref:DUF3017 family protein n=1 Tax=Rudaeicoccus suwonensis TaxID=657409 RepID=A0A561E8P1_9MICO|nr:DUF3017 domain-containing protein [Rudaeicoccus suwonensis]TWE11973.1 DUF3017 family protein [Rudaeicoccus suwonensis]
MSQFRLGPLWWAVLAAVATGVLVTFCGSVRVGGFLIAAAMVLAAIARLMMHEEALGAIAVRSKATDAVVLLGLAAALAVIFAKVKLGGS